MAGLVLLSLYWACFLVVSRGERGASYARALFAEEWVVEVAGGTEVAQQLAEKYGLASRGQIGNLNNFYHFSSSSSGRLLGVLSEKQSHINSMLAAEPNVGYIEQQVMRKRYKRSYVEPSACAWQEQWSLRNTGQTSGPAGLDLNVQRAWLQGVSGNRIVVAVVDDGVDWQHPALRPNFNSAASYDFINFDPDPAPNPPTSLSDNSHGTSCAGEIAMIRDSVCGAGVAYSSSIAGIKFDVDQSSDIQEAKALGYKSSVIQVYSNSWGPLDDGIVVEGPGILVQSTFEIGTSEGRNGKGSIYVWAAGNGGNYNDSCAADGYASSIYTIAVGSADQNGRQAYYDENCAAKMATTFSYNSDDSSNRIRTTTLNGKCTSSFTGTSASAPLLAGTIALALEANSNLTWRDVQYLIAYTSDRSRLVGGDWVVNSAGLSASVQFGFGAVNAEALVARAKHWITVPQQSQSAIYGIQQESPGATNKQPFIGTITVSSSDTNILFLEHTQLILTLQLYGSSCYSNAELVRVTLTSPQGTHSTLLPYRRFDSTKSCEFKEWPFTSVHFWGENPVGNWTLQVDFSSPVGTVVVILHQLHLYGTEHIPEAVRRIPRQCDQACAHTCGAPGPTSCDSCTLYRTASNLTCVSTCGHSLTQYSGYCIDQVTKSSPVCSLSIIVLVVVAVGCLLSIGACFIVTCLICVYCVRSAKKKRSRQLVSCEEEEEFGDYVPVV